MDNGYIRGNKVIQCFTKEQAEQVVKIAHELGIKWSSSPSDVTFYYSGICYSIGAYKKECLSYAERSFYENLNFKIIPASEFIDWYNSTNKKNTTISSIKINKPKKLKLNFKL